MQILLESMMSINKVDEIKKLYSTPLDENEVAFIYLGFSRVIVRTSSQSAMIDPANLLTDEEIKVLKNLDLLFFTHTHGDHYNSSVTLALFEATNSTIIAEPSVANDLKGKIPPNKLLNANPGEKFTFNEIEVRTIQGVHFGSITLYQIITPNFIIFHGGDSGYVPVEDYSSHLAFLPTGSPSPTASPEHAYNLALELKPNVIVAIHGSASQSNELKAKVKESMSQTQLIIPEPYITQVVTL